MPTKKRIKRISPRVAITLPPIIYLEGKAQAKARKRSFSGHVADLILREGARKDPPPPLD